MDVSKLFKKASDAIERRNYDYALDLLQQILALDPNHVKSRQVLRATEWRLVTERGGKVSSRRMMAYLKGFGTLIKIYLNKMQKKNEKNLSECEKFLIRDPGNTLVLGILADAAEHCGFPETAIVVYEGIISVDKTNDEAYRQLGRLYTGRDVKTAQGHWEEVLRLKPGDPDANKAIRDLAALGTIQAGSWDSSQDYRDKIKDKDQAKKLEDDDKFIRTSDDLDRAIERLEGELGERPTAKQLVKLGDLYRQKGDFVKSRAAYERAFETDKAYSQAKVKLGDLRIHEYDLQIEKAKGLVAGDPAAAKELERLKAERLQFCIEDFARRVAAYPTDLELKFQLGKFYYLGGNMDKALTEFQQAVNEPKRRVPSLHYLGLCFVRKNMFDLAVAQLEKAVEGMSMNDVTKSVTYDLAGVYEKLGDKAKAIERYKSIYEVDIGFRDVSKKLELLYKERS